MEDLFSPAQIRNIALRQDGEMHGRTKSRAKETWPVYDHSSFSDSHFEGVYLLFQIIIEESEQETFDQDPLIENVVSSRVEQSTDQKNDVQPSPATTDEQDDIMFDMLYNTLFVHDKTVAEQNATKIQFTNLYEQIGKDGREQVSNTAKAYIRKMVTHDLHSLIYFRTFLRQLLCLNH